MELYTLSPGQVFAIKEVTARLIERLSSIPTIEVSIFYLCVELEQFLDEHPIPGYFNKITRETINLIVEDIEKDILRKGSTISTYNHIAKRLYREHNKGHIAGSFEEEEEVAEYARSLRLSYLKKLNKQASELIDKRIKQGR